MGVRLPLGMLSVGAFTAAVSVAIANPGGGAGPLRESVDAGHGGTSGAANAAADAGTAVEEASDLGAAQLRCERRMVEPLLRMIRTRVGEDPGVPAAALRPEVDAGPEEDEAGGVVTSPEGKSWATHGAAFVKGTDLYRRLRGVEYLVATVPDPVDTGLYHLTDTLVEAVQRGVEAVAHEHGAPAVAWRRDTFWAPWANAVGPDAGATDDPSASCRRLVPGVLVFRNDSAFATAGDAPLMVVFLVGETPTWGIHKLALTEALDFIDAARGGDEVRIVGPSFSGSSSSLRYALTAWRPSGGTAPCFTVVSGNATSDSNKATLETCGSPSMEASCRSCCKPGEPGAAPCIHFHATTAPDDERARNFWRYLQDRLSVDTQPGPGGTGCVLKGVAMLEESGTTYGGQFAQLPPAADGEQPTCGPEISLRFPPHISNVRRAYEAQTGSVSASDDPLLPALNPALDEPTEPVDKMPDLSPRTAFANDTLLDGIMEQLSLRGAQYLGIVATDPSDVIFLAAQSKSHLPDVRLFTFGSEVLLSHPRYQPDLNGMLVISSYPLLGAHDVMHGDGTGDGISSFFPSEHAQGVYNATVAILGKTQELLEYQRVTPVQRTSGTDQPAVWVTIIGRDGAFPLYEGQSYDDRTDAVLNGGDRTPARSIEVRPPRSWSFVFFAVTVLVAYFGALYLLAADRSTPRVRDGKRERRTWPPFASLFGPCHEVVRTRRDYCVALLHAALFGGYGGLVAIQLVPMALGTTDFDVKDSLAMGAGLGTTAMLGWCAALSIRAFWVSSRADVERAGETFVEQTERVDDSALAPERQEARSRRRDVAGRVWFMRLGAVVALAGATLPVIVPAYNSLLGAGERSLELAALYVRSTNLSSGVSPMTPWMLMFAIFVLWAACNLARLRIVSHVLETSASASYEGPGIVSAALGLVKIGNVEPDPRAPQDLPLLEAKLVRTLRYPAYEPLTWTVFVPMWLLPAYAFTIKAPSTVEGRWAFAGTSANFVYCTCLLLAVVVASFAVVELLLAWRCTRALLHRLARHPLAAAYSRLPDPLARSLTSQLSGQTPHADDLAIGIHALRMLAAQLESAKADGSPTAALLSKALPTDLADRLTNRATLAANAFIKEREANVRDGAHIDLGESLAVGHLVAASATLSKALASLWPHRPLRGTKAKSTADAWISQAENLVATVVTIFVYQYVRQFQHFMTLAVGAPLLFMVAVASYCFEPHHLIGAFSAVMLLAAVMATVWVFLGMERDELLSRIARTQAGRVTVNRDFVMRMVTWAVLPTASFIIVHYPQVANSVLFFVGPLLHSLR